MKLVLWDWNGTLLDDIDSSIVALNIILGRRGMPPVDKPAYRRIFMFPVIEYYKKLGFNFETEKFDDVAREFVAEYLVSSRQSRLFPKAGAALDYLKAKGYRQSVLSAMMQSDLVSQINANGVFRYFQDIIGLKDIYAVSKIANALNYIGSRNIRPEEVCIIGDTYHDYEVSKKIGCACILISNGHQELDRTRIEDAAVIRGLDEVCGHL